VKSFAIVLAAALVCAAAVPVSAAERLTDKQVNAIVDNLVRGFDKWKNALERKNLDDAIITNAAGKIEVKKFLKDFESEMSLVRQRLNADYAAGGEITTMLRRASDVEKRAQQPGANPLPEWKELAGQLAALATAYGVTLPLASSDAAAARMTDKDVIARLDDIDRLAQRVASETDKAMKQAKAAAADRDKSKQAMKALAETAKRTKSMVQQSTATTAQVGELIKAWEAATATIGGVTLEGPAKTAQLSLDAAVANVKKAFGVA